jgi:hypothetical protein
MPTREKDIASCWWQINVPAIIHTTEGHIVYIRHIGRSGGSVGPDVIDALLCFEHSDVHEQCTHTLAACAVEFHIHSSDWEVHGHHRDPAYNQVYLHVVQQYDSRCYRQDGAYIHTCVTEEFLCAKAELLENFAFPCQRSLCMCDSQSQEKVLQRAGLLRFEEKISRFVEELRQQTYIPFGETQAYDRVIIPALLEAVGYGRKRVVFRSLGKNLIEDLHTYDELSLSLPSKLDRARIAAILSFIRCVSTEYGSVWQYVQRLVERNSCNSEDLSACIIQLRTPFTALGIARTDIVMCNVVLPFLLALLRIQGISGNENFLMYAYTHYPALSSNAITRAMCRQLQLSHEPKYACQQQGLHFLYQQTCKQKLCDVCLAGKNEI